MKNKKVFWFSVLALACLVLTFTTSWIFIIPAVILMLINQKEILKNKK